MKVKVITEKMYDDKIYFIVGSISDFKRWVKKMKVIDHESVEDIPDTIGGLASMVRYPISKTKDEIAYVIFVKDETDIPILVHETNHLTYDALKRKGVELKDETKEVYAYYQEWLFKEVTSRRGLCYHRN